MELCVLGGMKWPLQEGECQPPQQQPQEPGQEEDPLAGDERRNRLALDPRFVRSCSQAIASNRFWAYCQLIDTLGGLLEDQSSWSEGCPCHDHVATSTPGGYSSRARRISADLKQKGSKALRDIGVEGPAVTEEMATCKMRGRRAAEFASGLFEDFLDTIVTTAHSHIISVLAPLNSEDRAVVRDEWTNASVSRLNYCASCGGGGGGAVTM